MGKGKSKRLSNIAKNEYSQIYINESQNIRNESWVVVGSSVRGKSHLDRNIPCQDSYSYHVLDKRWGIIAVSDGAGSAKHSELGSQFVVNETIKLFREVLEQKKWRVYEQLPSAEEWSQVANLILLTLKDKLIEYAVSNELEPRDLSCTIIVVIFSPFGLLITHIGDGRAGYKIKNNGWKSMITPHKGEEANQTIFITANWHEKVYTLSGVSVPENSVIKGDISAFVIMTDGCEMHCFQCNYYDSNKNTYFDPNKPHPGFFDPLILSLEKMINNQIVQEELEKKWENFLFNGTPGLIDESDDKTMIIGIHL